MTHYDTGGQFRPPLFDRVCAHIAEGILAGAKLMGLASVIWFLGRLLWTMGR